MFEYRIIESRMKNILNSKDIDGIEDKEKKERDDTTNTDVGSATERGCHSKETSSDPTKQQFSSTSLKVQMLL